MPENGIHVPGTLNTLNADGTLNNTYTTHSLNGTYTCFLMNPKSLLIPIWAAEVKGKIKRANDRNNLNRKMAGVVAETLKSSGYIAH